MHYFLNKMNWISLLIFNNFKAKYIVLTQKSKISDFVMKKQESITVEVLKVPLLMVSRTIPRGKRQGKFFFTSQHKNTRTINCNPWLPFFPAVIHIWKIYSEG